ncbi:MAG: hypothetical protein HY760_06610 [Nitrospirae bacterium]|nr:hypothetical protein [Nitrospirota bacterium]
MKLPIVRITEETPDTKTFQLDLSGYPDFLFLPGQFVIVRAELFHPAKNRVTPLNRAFSLSSSPLERGYIEFTAKRYQDGRMTPWLCDSVEAGELLAVKGPSGEFTFREGETDEIVLVAGGIGVAPYRSIIRYILARDLPVKIRLLYSARTPNDFAFKDEFDDLARKDSRFECLYTVTREHAGWTGRVGRVDESLLRDFLSNPRTLFYLCGPDRMIDALSGTLKSLGAAEDRIRFERW